MWAEKERAELAGARAEFKVTWWATITPIIERIVGGLNRVAKRLGL